MTLCSRGRSVFSRTLVRGLLTMSLIGRYWRTAGRLFQLRVEFFAKDAVSIRGDGDGTAAVDAAYPSLDQAVGAQCRADGSRKMRPAFAPIEAGPAQDTGRALSVASQECFDIDAEPSQEFGSGACDYTGVGRQLGIAGCHQSIRKSHSKATRKMVVAGPGRLQGLVARTDGQLRSIGLEA